MVRWWKWATCVAWCLFSSGSCQQGSTTALERRWPGPTRFSVVLFDTAPAGASRPYWHNEWSRRRVWGNEHQLHPACSQCYPQGRDEGLPPEGSLSGLECEDGCIRAKAERGPTSGAGSIRQGPGTSLARNSRRRVCSRCSQDRAACSLCRGTVGSTRRLRCRDGGPGRRPHFRRMGKGGQHSHGRCPSTSSRPSHRACSATRELHLSCPLQCSPENTAAWAITWRTGHTSSYRGPVPGHGFPFSCSSRPGCKSPSGAESGLPLVLQQDQLLDWL